MMVMMLAACISMSASVAATLVSIIACSIALQRRSQWPGIEQGCRSFSWDYRCSAMHLRMRGRDESAVPFQKCCLIMVFAVAISLRPVRYTIIITICTCIFVDLFIMTFISVPTSIVHVFLTCDLHR